MSSSSSISSRSNNNTSRRGHAQRLDVMAACSDSDKPLASDNDKLLARFREGVLFLDQVQKGLNQYLETKRDVFPRFYFLSNDDLLTILSESKDVLKLNPHLKKVFEAVDHATFTDDLLITHIVSPEKEVVELSRELDPKGASVETWLLALEVECAETIRDIMKLALADYPEAKRTDW